MIFNRTLEKAQVLAKEIEGKAFIINELGELGHYDILINTTSVGMSPGVDKCPIPSECILEGSVVMDIITSPKETKLLQEAKKRGCKVVYGKEMFINQALYQMQLWFGERADRVSCESAIREYYS